MAIDQVVITIPMVPGRHLSGNARTHWGSRKRDARLLREAAKRAVFEGCTGAEREWLFFGYSPSRIQPRLIYDCEIAWPKGRLSHDDDNAWQMIKPARDGVAEAARINDSTMMTGVMTQMRAGKDQPGRITLTFRRYDPAL
jgi:hypothetical protein